MSEQHPEGCPLVQTAARWTWSATRLTWTSRHTRVFVGVPLGKRSQVRLLKAIDVMRWLTQDDRWAEVSIKKLGYLPEGDFALGECSIGQLDMSLSTRLFSNEKYPVNEFMPIFTETTNLLYVIAHEWGHASDHRSSWAGRFQHGRCPCRLALPPECKDFRESYAEAYAEWYLSKGLTANLAAKWYAVRNEWRMVW
jgi:hypothetical protein